MLKKMLTSLAGVLLLSVASGVENPQCWMRVKLLESVPAVDGTLQSMVIAPRPHVFLRKTAWGADGGIKEFPVQFHSVIDWDALASVPEVKTGMYSPWIDITKQVYSPYRPDSRWFAKSHTYGTSMIHISFFSRQNDKRKDRRPIFKRNEAGNLEKITVQVEFATEPKESAVVCTIRATETGSVISIFAEPEAKTPEEQFATVTERITRMLTGLKALGLKQEALPQKILISGREYPGHFYPLFSREAIGKLNELYRFLGIRSIQYSTVEKPASFLQYAWKTSDPVFTEGTRPEWVAAKGPADPGLKEKSRNAGRRLPSSGVKAHLVKFGDETTVLPEKFLKQPEVRAMFTAFLKERQVAPKALGAESLEKAEPFTSMEKAVTPELRRRYYYTALFRSEAMLNWYRDMIDGIRGGTPDRLIATGEICWESSRTFPEIFRAFELGVFDVASHELSTMLWVMPHGALYRLIAQRSAARRGKTAPGILYGSERGRQPDIVELDSTSALIHGMRHFYWYGSSPFQPEGMKGLRYYAALQKTNHRIARMEDLIIDGHSSFEKPSVALVKSYAAELWQRNAQDSRFLEFELAAAGLAWNQVAFDIVSDEQTIRHCAEYKVIYLASDVVPEAVCRRLLEWVNAGGILVLTGDAAATRNEFNEALLFAEAAGMTEQNGLQMKNLGKGKICRISGTPGKNLRNSFEPLDRAVPHQQVFHRISGDAAERYLAPLSLLPEGVDSVRPAACSRKGIDTGFYEARDLSRAAVLLADYTEKTVKPVTLRMALRGTYSSASDENGRKYPAVKENGRTVLKDIPVGASTLLILEK